MMKLLTFSICSSSSFRGQYLNSNIFITILSPVIPSPICSLMMQESLTIQILPNKKSLCPQKAISGNKTTLSITAIMILLRNKAATMTISICKQAIPHLILASIMMNRFLKSQGRGLSLHRPHLWTRIILRKADKSLWVCLSQQVSNICMLPIRNQ